MRSSAFLRVLGLLSLVTVTALSAGCSASGAADDGEDDGANITNDELRTRSEDMFKPTSAPVQVVPATLKNLVHWELYTSERGTTVIGRSKTKKAKAIFVQLIDPHRASPDKVVMRGSGYLVASDFRLDSRNAQRELRLLAAAIRKDFAAVVPEPLPANPDPVPVAPEPVPPAEPATPTPTPAPSTTPTPPVDVAPPAIDPEIPETVPAAPTPTAPPVVDKPCVRSTIKTLIFGLDILKDTASVITNGVKCPVSRDACGSAVAAFEHGVTMVGQFDALTCKSR